MKKFAVYILMILHINAYVFLPQCPEQDAYNAIGQQVDDINSLMEFVLVELGIDKTADDEDDDSGNQFVSAPVIYIVCNQNQFQIILQSQGLSFEKTKFPSLRKTALSDALIEVQTPPPDFTA